MKLTMTPIPSSLFTYDEETKTFSTEISDLGPGFRFQLIYDDAREVGFQMVSTRTGEVVTFYLEAPHFDGEGELTHWTCGIVREDMSKHKLWGVIATIFND
jgi:hypothetical protein